MINQYISWYCPTPHSLKYRCVMQVAQLALEISGKHTAVASGGYHFFWLRAMAFCTGIVISCTMQWVVLNGKEASLFTPTAIKSVTLRMSLASWSEVLYDHFDWLCRHWPFKGSNNVKESIMGVQGAQPQDICVRVGFEYQSLAIWYEHTLLPCLHLLIIFTVFGSE